MYNRTLSGSVRTLELDSAALKGNPLGDPHVRRFPVYLPPGYDESSERYPVIYALAGFTGTGLNMPNFTVWDESLPEQIDDLIVSDECPPVVVVMPDCFTALGGSQYLDSPLIGAYQTYLTTDLLPFIDASLRTIPKASARGVVGKSSGGFAALTLGMRHPDMFAAVGCHSGDMYFEYCYLRDFPKAVDTLNRFGGVASFLDQFNQATVKGPMIPTLNIVAMAAAYARDDATAIELPFVLPSGELQPEVWERWLEFDPVRLVEQRADALKGLKLLYMDVGELDEYALHHGARIMAGRLEALGVDFSYEEHPGGHFGINHRYKVSLKALAAALSGGH